MSIDVNRKLLAQSLMKLLQPEGQVQCEYVWIDGTIKNFRTKSKTWNRVPCNPEELPLMEFCGSATYFDVGDLADYYAKPVRIFKDPFRRGNNRLIFCETYSREKLPTFANNRFRLLSALQTQPDPVVSQFTFYQSYTLFRQDGKPLSYLNPAYGPDTKAVSSCGQELSESHYRACLYAGIDLASMEVVKNSGEWKYSIGPRSCVDLGDAVWMSRFLLKRVGEDFGVDVNFQPEIALRLHTHNITYEQKQKILGSLLSKFVVKDTQNVQIETRDKNIWLTSLDGYTDPYSFLKQVLALIFAFLFPSSMATNGHGVVVRHRTAPVYSYAPSPIYAYIPPPATSYRYDIRYNPYKYNYAAPAALPPTASALSGYIPPLPLPAYAPVAPVAPVAPPAPAYWPAPAYSAAHAHHFIDRHFGHAHHHHAHHDHTHH